MPDLELLHHYLTVALPTMPVDNVRRELFGTSWVQLGLKVPYVMHGILALSAVHLYSIDHSRHDVIDRCHAHRNNALRLVRPAMVNMTEQEVIPIFILSTFIAVTALGDLSMSRFHSPHGRVDIIHAMVDCVELCRGIHTVIEPHWDYLRNSWAGPGVNYEDDLGAQLPAPIKVLYPVMLDLQDLARAAGTEEERDACLDAVQRCFESMAHLERLEDKSASMRIVHIALMSLQRPFLNMLSAKDPIALVIMAHFTAMMHMTPEAWWTGGLAEMMFEHVKGLLDGRWGQLLAWPKSIVYGTTPVAMETEK